MDRAILRTAEELQLSQPEIADELGLVTVEQRVGCHRADAWKNFGDRTGVESIRALASILIQADKFGYERGNNAFGSTRKHSACAAVRMPRNRPPKPQSSSSSRWFCFIFPALFVVTLGPSMIVIMEDFKNFLQLIRLKCADISNGGMNMDNATLIRIIAGVLFVVGLVFLIQRRRRKVS